MTKKLSLIIAGICLVAVTSLATLMLIPTQTRANPDTFGRFSTAPASSTLRYMTPGTGTTTLAATNPSSFAFKSAVALVQVTATSTSVAGQVLLDARIEGTQDDATSTADWYPIAIIGNTTLGTTPANATTTLLTTPYNSNRLAMSTTTLGYSGNWGGTGSATLMLTSFDLPTKTRHIRIVFTDPSGGGNYGLYAEIVTKKEVQ